MFYIFVNNLADLTKYLFLFFVLYIVWFVQVSFVYPSRPNDPILSRVDFALKAGTVTALVGSSGAGKSTIASLLLRYVLIALCSRIIPKSYSSWWASCACCQVIWPCRRLYPRRRGRSQAAQPHFLSQPHVHRQPRTGPRMTTLSALSSFMLTSSHPCWNIQ